MPNRILKEAVKISEQVNRLSPEEEVFFYRLMVTVDDYGRMDGRPRVLAAALYPLRSVRPEAIARRLDALESADLVRRYEVEDRPYVYLPKWAQHQRLRAANSKFPVPPSTDAATRGQPRADGGQSAAPGGHSLPQSQSNAQSDSETKSRTDPVTNDSKPQANGQPKGERMKAWLGKNPWQEETA